MLKLVLIIVGLLLILGVGFFIMLVRGQDVSQYEHLLQPKISNLPDTSVLEVAFTSPTDGLNEVFGVLFKTYFKLKGVPKMPWKTPPSAARYTNELDFAMEPEKRADAFKNMIWEGTAAMVLPPGITTLPKSVHDNLTCKIATWKYGLTAEILHVGPYDQEAPAVKTLMDFIDRQGYEIAGLHEEVYLKSPGTPLCKPEDYYTIIRYPVKKK